MTVVAGLLKTWKKYDDFMRFISKIEKLSLYVLLLLQKVSKSDREVIARLRNCILALAASKIPLYDTTITYAYEESMKYEEVRNYYYLDAITYLL